MKLIVALCLIGAVAAAQYPRDYYEMKFESWRLEHGMEYATGEEYVHRLENYINMHDFIVAHNARFDAGEETYTVAHNQFSAHSSAEFKAEFLGLAMPAWRLRGSENHVEATELADVDPSTLADSVDWRSKNAVTPVKNQGGCGSCWAFSTTGSMEGALAIKSGNLQSFSEQMLVDCDHNGDQGCNGGLMDNAFGFIKQNGGLCLESDYAYTGSTGSCKSSSCTTAGTITGHTDVPTNNEDALKAAVAQQPVSVAIEADQQGFQSYSGGVFSGNCGTQLDHGVLAVGYGTDNGSDYWLVKNSWGASWGDQGYIKMARGSGSGNAGQCGIASDPSYPQA